VEGLKGKGMIESDRNGQSEPRIALSGMLNDESTHSRHLPTADGHERSRMTRTSRLGMIHKNVQMSAWSPHLRNACALLIDLVMIDFGRYETTCSSPSFSHTKGSLR
jgi:hypothetical protein